MVYFFVLGVQYLAELKVSMTRIDDFLSMPEPPPPTHQRGAEAAAAANGAAPVAPRKRLSLDLLWRRPEASRAASEELPRAAEADGGGVPVGGLRLGGADYDWARNIEQMGLPPRGPSGGGAAGEGGDKGGPAAEQANVEAHGHIHTIQVALIGFDSVRYRQPIVPGDLVHLRTKVIKVKKRIFVFEATAHVENKLVCEAEMMAQIEFLKKG